jgi:hypothetical protein
MTLQLRRRVLGAALAFVALSALILFLTALAWPKAGQFEFLKGRQLVKLEPKMKKSAGPLNITYYSFKGDYSALLKAAETELASKGYERTAASESYSEFAIGDLTRLAKRPIVRVYQTAQTVHLFRDCRFEPSGHWKPTEKGWVTVRIMGKAPLTGFDRFKGWVGL